MPVLKTRQKYLAAQSKKQIAMLDEGICLIQPLGFFFLSSLTQVHSLADTHVYIL